MRKVQFTAVLWTMILAIPFTAISLSILAYTTEHLIQISTAVAEFSRQVSFTGRGLFTEFTARWPEVAGMVVGQMVLLAILYFARQDEKAKQETHH